MKQFLTLVFAAVAIAAPKVGLYRYSSQVPERMFPGYTQIAWLAPAWEFDVTCDATTSACTSPDYTPAGSDVFTPDPNVTPPGAVQNAFIEWHKPVYKAVNIGTTGLGPAY